MFKTITQWANDVYELARSKGWHSTPMSDREMLATYLINIHGEVSEAWEAFRAGKINAPCDKAEKMRILGLPELTCLEEELADIVIRVFDTAQTLGVDIERAIETKHAYNGTRAQRHGGKLA
jgi:NTP pyrophosphatase (non-canonical NTP hydrolase)